MKRKWMLNGIFLVIALVAFSLSLFKYDHQVWITAWIAPIFMIRFMRENKWLLSVIFGFLVLQTALGIGMSQMFSSVGLGSAPGDISLIMIKGSIKSGTMFVAVAFLVPFILDKVLHNYMLKPLSSLIFPSALVAIELLYSFSVGTLYSFGQSQLAIQPFIMTYSLFGVYCGTFIIGWFASIVNKLWEEEWDIKKLGLPGFVFSGITIMI